MRATHLKSGKKVAIKRIRLRSQGDAKRILREAFILSELERHPNVNRLVDVLTPEGCDSDFDVVFLVFELAQHDLRDLMRSMYYFEEHNVKQIMFDILCALDFVHASGVVHRDLKPANILVNKLGRA